MERVLVTGGAGFIGSHIVDKLIEQGYEVAVVDNLSTGKIENIERKDVRFYEVDIVDDYFQVVVENFKPKYIIHQAAQASVPVSIKDIRHDTDVNIKGSINVIEAARRNAVRKIVFASTAAVYGEPEYLPVDENHPIKPQSPYGLSKYTVELYLKLAKEIYDINYTILRYSNVYGPRQNAKGEGGVVAIFADLISKSKTPMIFGDGEQTRDFIYVEDVAKVNVQAIKTNVSGIFNVSTSKKISVNDLFNAIRDSLQTQVTPNYQAERNGDIKHSILCNNKTLSSFGLTDNVSLYKGIESTLEYYSELVTSK